MSLKIIFRILHALVALSAVIICAILILAKGGHPPGIVFVPFVLAYWVVTHLFLLGLKWFLSFMARPKKDSISQGWPPLLTLSAILSGCILIFVVYGVFHDYVLRSYSIDFKDIIWALMFFIAPALLFGGVIFGAITGSKYASWIAAAGPIAYIAYSIMQITNGASKPSLLNMIIVLGCCIALSSYLIFSSRVKEIFHQEVHIRTSFFNIHIVKCTRTLIYCVTHPQRSK